MKRNRRPLVRLLKLSVFKVTGSVFSAPLPRFFRELTHPW